MQCVSDDSSLFHWHRSRHDKFRACVRSAHRRCAARGSQPPAMGNPRRACRGADATLVPLPAGRRACHATARQDAGTQEWIAGRLARRRAGETPGRVVRSAKSWLCHHAADRTAPILPWGSEDLVPAQKISPVQAAALILNYLRGAWDSRFAQSGCAFDDQEITITVPASFDAAAQRLTLNAAEEAGFPSSVRLLEEPQAVFYCWLERHSSAEPLWAGDAHNAKPRHVLIVDVGGGTSDFSLFALRSGPSDSVPDITRVAVSEHILLGGDNIDLALAVLLETRLVGERGQISGPQWEHLVASCRDLKEHALSGIASVDARFTVALPGRGSRPGGWSTNSNSGTRRGRTAGAGWIFSDLRCARAALSNPGRFARLGTTLRRRRRGDAPSWPISSGTAPAWMLCCSMAVRSIQRSCASGCSNKSRHGRAAPDHANLTMPNPISLSHLAPHASASCCTASPVASRPALPARCSSRCRPRSAAPDQTVPSALICVLPRNASAEQVFDINLPGLEVRTDQVVSFQACSSPRHGRCHAGDVLPWDAEAFNVLPPLQTIIRTDNGPDAGLDRTVSVRLAAKMNALGLLQISCVSMDPLTPQAWPLEFNLRPHELRTAAARGALRRRLSQTPRPRLSEPRGITSRPHSPVRRRRPTD